ncbi:hypothetical protein HPB51_003248 [Rhipicephalus microplus]|uniref:Uncharacterized protein n=1 Tax=Rhipicephalus microplus TaxID=6941 RepID=A0A9J6EEQ6_RHIMP|nr:hypothetical protein HPB51_003248 [Rhipicephalus microplus]
MSGVIVRGSGINPVSSVVSGPAAVSARERGALHVPPLWAAAVPCRREGAAARGVGGFPTVGGGDPVRPGTGTLSPLCAPFCFGSAASPPPPRHESAVVPQRRVERERSPRSRALCAPSPGTHAAVAPVASRLLLARGVGEAKKPADDPSSSLCCGVSALSPAFAGVNAQRALAVIRSARAAAYY